MQKYIFPFVLLFAASLSFGQFNHDEGNHKCGGDPVKDALMKEILGDHWGYSYDSLLNDMGYWEASDYVQVQSIGQSVQGREIYELTITSFDETKNEKRRIFIHARTHPGEVQSFWVTDEMINFLIGDTEIGNFLREECIFHIIPMYNPDGVELEYPRENANGIDLEREWDKEVPEIEAANLKARFQEVMLEENQVEIALNMHSAYECLRYFWVHHPNGTSSLYYELEEEFVEGVRSHFIEGIEPFDSHVSWSGGNPMHFPESWWWINYEEAVMALTYEDMNCESAGDYDLTAYALLHGISDYLGLGFETSSAMIAKDLSAKAYPNPFRDRLSVQWEKLARIQSIYLTDVCGKLIRKYTPENNSSQLEITGENLSEGVYFLNIIDKNQRKSLKIVKQ